MTDTMEALKGNVEKATGHEKEGVGATMCGEKQKRRRKATKRLEKMGKLRRKEGGEKPSLLPQKSQTRRWQDLTEEVE